MTDKAIPINEVFEQRARGVRHLMHNRGNTAPPDFHDDYSGVREALTVTLFDGDTPALEYYRPTGLYKWSTKIALGPARKHHSAHCPLGIVRFDQIKPDGLADVEYGDEHISKSEKLGSREKVIDNRKGVSDVEVNFRDMFGETDGTETDKSAGTSLKVSVEATQSIEGIAEFKESVESEAHAEISESQSKETSRESEDEEGTTVPVGKRVRIIETRERADGEIDMTAKGKFTHAVKVGRYVHGIGWIHGAQSWDSWSDFCDTVRGDAPDNWALATDYKRNPVRHDDLWALDDLSATMKYKIKFEGRIVSSYTVE